MTATRRLVLVRHAKAERGHRETDHARSLTARGRRDAAAVGRWLLDQGLVPDLALVSSAVRAAQTWTAASSELDDPPPVRAEDALYDATVAAVLEVVGSTADAVRTLVVVGHEPTTSDVAATLAGEGSDPAAVAVVRAGLPTSGVAVLELGQGWDALTAGGAVLVRHASPRG